MLAANFLVNSTNNPSQAEGNNRSNKVSGLSCAIKAVVFTAVIFYVIKSTESVYNNSTAGEIEQLALDNSRMWWLYTLLPLTLLVGCIYGAYRIYCLCQNNQIYPVQTDEIAHDDF